MMAVWLTILWNKYVLRKKPAVPLSNSGKTYTEEAMTLFRSINKLVHPVEGLPLLAFDLDSPAVFISYEVYALFRDNMEAFVSNLYLYAEFQSHYIHGLSERREDGQPVVLPLCNDEEESPYLNIIVTEGGLDSKAYKVGRYKEGDFVLVLQEPDKHPTEHLVERAEIILKALKKQQT